MWICRFRIRVNVSRTRYIYIFFLLRNSAYDMIEWIRFLKQIKAIACLRNLFKFSRNLTWRMVAIYDVISHNIKMTLDCSPIQWSVAFVVLGVDVTEAENIFVPNDNVEMAISCSLMENGRFGSIFIFINHWIFCFACNIKSFFLELNYTTKKTSKCTICRSNGKKHLKAC